MFSSLRIIRRNQQLLTSSIKNTKKNYSLSRNSRSTKSENEVSEDDKARVVGEGMLKFFKKYGLVVIPLSSFLILSIDIINKPGHRNFIEEYMPKYVEFMREYYGFSDEDPKERAYNKFVDSEYSKSSKVEVNYKGKSYYVVVDSMKMKFEEILELTPIPEEEKSKISKIELYASNMINFMENMVEADEERERFIERKENEEITQPILSFSLNSSTFKNSTPFFYSRSKDDISSVSLSSIDFDKYNQLVFKPKGNLFNPLVFSCLHNIFSAYNNMAYTMSVSFENYLQYSSRLFLNKELSEKNRIKLEMNKNNIENFVKKQDYNDRLSALDSLLAKLRQEKYHGIKSFDVISEEIKQVESEIAKLKRENNTFYFF